MEEAEDSENFERTVLFIIIQTEYKMFFYHPPTTCHTSNEALLKFDTSDIAVAVRGLRID